MSERKRLIRLIEQHGDEIELIELKNILCRDSEWIAYALTVFSIQRFGGESSEKPFWKNKPSWKNSGLRIQTSDAVRIVDEHLRCSEGGMYPGDPTPKDIYERLAPAIRRDSPRDPVCAYASRAVETTIIPVVMVRAAYHE